MKLSVRGPVVLSSGRPFTRTGTHRHCHVASVTWQLVKLTFPCLGDNCGHRHPTIVNDLLSGQFNDPVRIVAFNTFEHWAEDVSGNSEIKNPLRHSTALPVLDHRLDFSGTTR
jgi:hypothetical protein